mgnify:CR=1 FL=1
MTFKVINKHYADAATAAQVARVAASVDAYLAANAGRASVDFVELKTKLAAQDRAVPDGVLHQALSDMGHGVEEVGEVRPEFDPDAEAVK